MMAQYLCVALLSFGISPETAGMGGRSYKMKVNLWDSVLTSADDDITSFSSIWSSRTSGTGGFRNRLAQEFRNPNRSIGRGSKSQLSS